MVSGDGEPSRALGMMSEESTRGLVGLIDVMWSRGRMVVKGTHRGVNVKLLQCAGLVVTPKLAGMLASVCPMRVVVMAD
jgi:hypothetical protein